MTGPFQRWALLAIIVLVSTSTLALGSASNPHQPVPPRSFAAQVRGAQSTNSAIESSGSLASHGSGGLLANLSFHPGTNPVGPFGPAIAPNGELFFSSYSASTSGQANLSIISGATNHFVSNLTLAAPISAPLYVPSTGMIWVATASNISIVDPSTDSFASAIPLFGPSASDLIYDTYSGLVYGVQTNVVLVISPTSQQVTAVSPNPTWSTGIAPTLTFNPDNGNVYVLENQGGEMGVISGTTWNTTIPLGGFGTTPTVDPQNDRIYAYDGPKGIAVVSGVNNSIMGVLPIPTVFPPTLDPRTGNLFFASTPCPGEVTVVSAASNQTIASITLGGCVTYLPAVWANATGYIYLQQYYGEAGSPFNLTIINATTLVPFARIAYGGGTDTFVYSTAGPTYDPLNGDVYAPDPNNITAAAIGWSKPQVGASANVTSGTAALTVSFSSDPQGGLGNYSYWWRFGDGARSFTPDPSHTYDAPGMYSVILVVNDSANDSASATLQIEVTPAPELVSVSISPASASVFVGAQAAFSSSLVCAGGPCPAGTVFAWSLTNAAGELASPTGASTTFIAGATEGMDTLFVNATLWGVTRQSGPVPISISPKLSSVGVTPASTAVMEGGTATLEAADFCSGGPCPGGTLYSWSMNRALGLLNSTTATTVQFTAGWQEGTVALFVNASLDGIRVQSSPVVVQVHASPLVAFANATYVSGGSGCGSGPPSQVETFSGAARGGSAPYAWSWTFGDGSSAVLGQNATHTYTTDGPFVAELRVNDSLGNHAFANTIQIIIQQPPCAARAQGSPFSILGLGPTLSVALIGGIAALVAAIVVLMVLRRKRKGGEEEPPAPSSPPIPASEASNSPAAEELPPPSS
jgi:PKD repeat protein